MGDVKGPWCPKALYSVLRFDYKVNDSGDECLCERGVDCPDLPHYLEEESVALMASAPTLKAETERLKAELERAREALKAVLEHLLPAIKVPCGSCRNVEEKVRAALGEGRT